jgi:bacterioferritin
MLEHWGVVKLGAYEYEESIDEMKHADMLIKRLLFLGGEPRLELDKLLIGNTVQEVLECDLRLEQLAIPQLREAIPYCEPRLRDPRPLQRDPRERGGACRLHRDPIGADDQNRY